MSNIEYRIKGSKHDSPHYVAEYNSSLGIIEKVFVSDGNCDFLITPPKFISEYLLNEIKERRAELDARGDS